MHISRISCARRKPSTNIESYFFLEKPEDEQLYQKRRRLKGQGLGNLTALETECDRSWEEGRNSIEKLCQSMTKLIKRTTQEMQQRGQKCYEKMKRDLAEAKNHLDLYMLDPHFELSLKEIVLCESAPISPVLVVMLEDCRVSVAETLMANFQVQAWDLKTEGHKDWIAKLQQVVSDQMEQGAIGVAARAAEDVKQLGGEAPYLQAVAFEYNQKTSQRFQSLFASSAEREAEECLRAGEAAQQVRNFDKALEELKRGIVLLHGIDNMQLNLQLNNCMAETYCVAERWQDTVPLCEKILKTWGNEPYHFELLRTLFYLTQAYYQHNQQNQGYAALKKWAEKLQAGSPRCLCIILCIWTITLRQEGKLSEAVERYDEVLKLQEPRSYIIFSSRCPWYDTFKAHVFNKIGIFWSFMVLCICIVIIFMFFMSSLPFMIMKLLAILDLDIYYVVPALCLSFGMCFFNNIMSFLSFKSLCFRVLIYLAISIFFAFQFKLIVGYKMMSFLIYVFISLFRRLTSNRFDPWLYIIELDADELLEEEISIKVRKEGKKQRQRTCKPSIFTLLTYLRAKTTLNASLDWVSYIRI